MLDNEELFSKVKVISNRFRFRILELTQEDALSVSQIGAKLGLAYTKCADYVSMLEKIGLVEKEKKGKEVFVRSCVELGDGVLF